MSSYDETSTGVPRGGPIQAILAMLLPIGTILWVTDVPRRLGFLFYPEQYAAAMLGIAVFLVFLSVPASGGNRQSRAATWFDLVLAVTGTALCAFIAVQYPHISTSVARPPEAILAGAVLIPILLEGARRTAGLPITLVAVSFVILGLISHLLPGTLESRHVPPERLSYYLTWNTNALLGTPLRITVTTVVAFVLFGQALFVSGGSRFFTDISMALMGRRRGGQAKIAIIASALFGTISGSVVANVVSTGVITIPLMKRAGYRAHVAAAVEAVASTGGQIMPPVMGIAAFIMAEFLQMSYSEIAVAAVIPAALYFAALFIQVDLEAGRFGISGVQDAELPRATTALRHGWSVCVPFAVLVGSIFWLSQPIDLSALYAVLSVIVMGRLFGYRGETLNLRRLGEVLEGTGRGVLEIFMIAPLAGVVIGVLNATGLGFNLALSLIQLAGGSVFLLLVLTAIVSVLLGMGMPTVGVYILLATLIAPALIQVGIEPLAAHLFIFYFGMLSMITPPVAIGAFAAASIAKCDPMRTGFMASRMGWAAFVLPFLFVFSPSLLFKADPFKIAFNVATALAAVWLVSAAFVGFGRARLTMVFRTLYLIAGAGLLLPVGLFGTAPQANVAGGVLGAAVFALDVARAQRAALRRPDPSAGETGT